MFDIWIDVANAPRVLFFKSLLNDLKKYSIFISTSPIVDTNKLMKKFGMKGEVIGGVDIIDSKKFSAIIMAIKLAYKVPAFNIALTLEGARPIPTAKIRGKTIINFLDNDIKFISSSITQKLETELKKLSDFVIVPRCSVEIFSKYLNHPTILTYDGYKEHITISDFNPNKEFLNDLPFNEYIILRSGSISSFYVEKSITIIPELLERFRKENINVIYLPRYTEDKKYAKELENIYVPPKPLNGLDLNYYAKATITGSGTMAREAVVLGTTAVSFFPGDRLLSVDQDLVDKNKMLHSRDPIEIVDYVITDWNKRKKPEFEKAKKVKKEVIEFINNIINKT